MLKPLSTILLVFLFANCNTKKHLLHNQLVGAEQLENHLIPPIIINGKRYFYSIEERMKYHKIQGLSIAVIKNGKIAWSKGYGSRQPGTSKLVDAATMFQAGSVSKPIAGLVALLAAKNLSFSTKLDIKQWVSSQIFFNKNFSNDTISIERILSHSAGFNVHGFLGYEKGKAIPTLAQIIEGESPCNSEPITVKIKPGTQWNYSGGGYEVLQQMLENALNQPFFITAEKLLFSKLEMKNSVFQHPLDEKNFTNFSEGHLEDGKILEGKHRIHPELMAAGLWTTPTDLAKAIIEIQKAQKGTSTLISKAMSQNILTPRLNNWGLGVVISENQNNRTFGHAGKNIGYTSNFFASVDKGFGIVIMTNSNMGFAIMDEIFRGASHLYNWNTHKPMKKTIVKLKRKQLEKYCGTFRLENSKDERIMKISTETNGSLKVVQTRDNRTMFVFPEGNDAFFEINKSLSLQYDFSETNKIKLINKNRYQFTKIN